MAWVDAGSNAGDWFDNDDWLLRTGFWDDSLFWVDAANWIDFLEVFDWADSTPGSGNWVDV